MARVLISVQIFNALKYTSSALRSKFWYKPAVILPCASSRSIVQVDFTEPRCVKRAGKQRSTISRVSITEFSRIKPREGTKIPSIPPVYPLRRFNTAAIKKGKKKIWKSSQLYFPSAGKSGGQFHTELNKLESPNNRGRPRARTDLQSGTSFLFAEMRSLAPLSIAPPGYGRIAMPLLIRFRLGKNLSTLLQVGTVPEGRPAGRDLSLR